MKCFPYLYVCVFYGFMFFNSDLYSVCVCVKIVMYVYTGMGMYVLMYLKKTEEDVQYLDPLSPIPCNIGITHGNV